jgi:hypothetical protein
LNLVKLNICFIALLVLIFLTGCSEHSKNTTNADQPTQMTDGKTQNFNDINPGKKPASLVADGKLQVSIKPADTPNIKLENHSGNYFSIKKPKDWVIETTGEYEDFGFRMHDPENPARQIFFYGNMRPFVKSDEARKAWETYISMGGYGEAKLYAEAPVLSPATVEQFFHTFSEFTVLASNYGIIHNFPSFRDLEVLESMPRNSAISSVALDDSIIRALFTNEGIPCEGLFAAGVADTMTSYMYNVDAGYYTVYVVTGISAPADEFPVLENVLAESLSTFEFTEEYIRRGVAQKLWETSVALQVGKTLSEAADSYNQAWHNRQRVHDALSQKRSDSTLGYDRLYDTITGEVYRAELGFYEEYDISRGKYANPNLEPVSDNDYDLYDKGISGYIYKR